MRPGGGSGKYGQQALLLRGILIFVTYKEWNSDMTVLSMNAMLVAEEVEY
jgi:hypothetical protein